MGKATEPASKVVARRLAFFIEHLGRAASFINSDESILSN